MRTTTSEKSATHSIGGRNGSSQWWLIAGVLAVYAVTMAVYFPDVVTNTDEGMYVAQAEVFAHGKVRAQRERPLLGRQEEYWPSQYPPGTAAIMAPFVYMFGWRGAYLVPLLGLIGLVLVTARWIEAAGRPILYSLLVLLYPATLVTGRVPLSGIPCALGTTSSILLFWTGAEREKKTHWWISGFVAGLTLTIREPGVLVILPFYLGALLRRERGIHALVISGLLGSLVRPLMAWIVFGDPFYLKDPVHHFSVSALIAHVPLYAFFTLILVPGGLLAGVLYRGRRWPEVIAASLLSVLFFASYPYAGEPSGGAKAMILSSRYLISVVPVFAFSLAHVVPDLLTRLSKRAPRLVRRVEVAGGTLLVFGALFASVAVHVVMDRFSSGHREIRDAIYEFTDEGAWVITNFDATGKYLDFAPYGVRTPIWIEELDPSEYDRVLDGASDLYLVLLERSDSQFWRDKSAEDEKLVADLAARADLELRYDRRVTSSDHLRIWRVTRASGTPP